MNTSTFTKLFAALAALHIAVEYVNENQNLIALTKLLPVAALSIYVYHRRGWRDLFLLAALLFSFSGDALLISTDPKVFLLGMGAFAMAHISYIYHFKNSGLPRKKWLSVLVLGVFGILFYAFTYSSLTGIFSYAIPIYMILILFMNHTVLSRWRTPNKSQILLIIGAFSFTLSDSLLGIHKFVESLPYANAWVMITYFIAQYGLVIGSLEHDEYQPGSTS